MAAIASYRVPGVYHEPQPRTPEAPAVRTDVAGFIGFDPRVRNGTTRSALTGTPPTGHAFRVDVAGFQHVARTVGEDTPPPGDFTFAIAPARDFVLSESTSSIPVAPGHSIVYTLLAKEEAGGFVLKAVAGAASNSGGEQPPADSTIVAALSIPLGTRWRRIAAVSVRREADAIFVTSHPAADFAIVRCDDYRDYVLAFGEPEDDGTLLGASVRAFFANGGRRCWIATLRRPDFEDSGELARAADDMVGLSGASGLEATGLERLLLVGEVTVVDVPDLYAQRVERTVRSFPLPPSEREACFLPCDSMPPRGTATSTDVLAGRPLFESSPPFTGTGAPNEVFRTQARLAARCVRDRWRVLLLLSVPRLPDGGTGPYVPPTSNDAATWRNQFDGAVKGTLTGAPSIGDTDEVSCAALYWPWVLAQNRVGTPVVELPPSAFAAAIVARRDLARGPQIAPANETLRGVVGTAAPLDDTAHGLLYEADDDALGLRVASVNVLRAFPGYGVQLWGARTLSTERLLRFIPVRRTLTAIELRMKAALELLVFEPNVPALWLQIAQTAFAILLPLFESGALRGTRPEEAFFVRCDGDVNPPEAIERGELLVEVGVALAAPAEFIVFRVGRREGVIEVLE